MLKRGKYGLKIWASNKRLMWETDADFRSKKKKRKDESGEGKWRRQKKRKMACISTATSIGTGELSTLPQPILDQFMINRPHGRPASSKHNQSSSLSDLRAVLKRNAAQFEAAATACCHFLSSSRHPLMTKSPRGTIINTCHRVLICNCCVNFGLISATTEIWVPTNSSLKCLRYHVRNGRESWTLCNKHKKT